MNHRQFPEFRQPFPPRRRLRVWMEIERSTWTSSVSRWRSAITC